MGGNVEDLWTCWIGKLVNQIEEVGPESAVTEVEIKKGKGWKMF